MALTDTPDVALRHGATGLESRPAPLYEHIDGKLRALLPAFALESSAAMVTSALRALGHSALAGPAGQRPRNQARLNADGMPIQFAMTLAPGRAARLQLLADPAAPGATGAERVASARGAVARLASLFDAEACVAAHLPWAEALVPDAEPALQSDTAGPLWVGAAFSAAAAPCLKVYANLKGGSAAGQHARMAAFAARFGQADAWLRASAQLAHRFGQPSGQLQPLGLSLVLGAGQAPAGRLYFSAPALLWENFEALGEHFGGRDYGGQLRRFGRTILHDSQFFPMESVVVSFGLGAAGVDGLKIGLSGQRVFDDDVQASERCTSWLRASGIDPALYRQATTILNGGPLSAQEHGVLAYLGVSAGHDATSSTFNFNPSWKR